MPRLSPENERVAVSAAFLLVLFCVVVTTLPGLGLSGQVTGGAQPVLDVTALGQNWSMFAPNPRRERIRLSVVVRYADGTRWTWRPPGGDRLVGAYWDYRWRKWSENAMAQDGLLLRTARFAAGHGPSPAPVSATVIRRSAPIESPQGRTGRWTVRRQTFTRANGL